MDDETIIDLYDAHAPGACRVLAVASGAGSALIANAAWSAGGAAVAAGATAASGGTILLVAAGVLVGVVASRTFCPGMVQSGRGKIRNLLSQDDRDHRHRFITGTQFDAFRKGLDRYGTVSRDDALILARLAYAAIERDGPPSDAGQGLGADDFAKAVSRVTRVYRFGPTAAV